MLMFLLGIVMLVVGYYYYGKFVEKILGPDDRKTPAVSSYDGVDYLVLPTWKNMLIQLLNIAGIGPVIGVILGVKFGAIVFLIIPLGNIFGGAVHDFVAGMMSLRHNGANLPALIQKTMGKPFYGLFSIFMCFLLLLVVAVFINIPAGLIDRLFPTVSVFWVAVVAIFVYYIIATIFPVDKIIGAIYPLFGAMLMIGTFAIFFSMIWQYSFSTPGMMLETPELKSLILGFREENPILPCLFVTIACGILSGFHATQSPIVARTMKSEREARGTFYGMMIVEGVIAMIWAAAGFAIYNLIPAKFTENSTQVLVDITQYFLGGWMGVLTIIAVVILAITSGDTAMRSLRLSLAEILNIGQTKLVNRVLLCLPLVVLVAGLLWWSNMSAESFKHLWNYFAWGNQVLGACTLTATSVWLFSQKKNGWVTLLPGMFMTFIVVTFIVWTSPAHKGPYGFGLNLNIAYVIGTALALFQGVWAYLIGRRRAALSPLEK